LFFFFRWCCLSWMRGSGSVNLAQLTWTSRWCFFFNKDRRVRTPDTSCY
jgi:hypothetical protein